MAVVYGHCVVCGRFLPLVSNTFVCVWCPTPNVSAKPEVHKESEHGR